MELNDLEIIRDELLAHPMYQEINTPDRVRVLMKHHVFAVWDFMSLLKRLQRSVTSISVPWLPYETPSFTRFINEIVLAEESDEDGRGGYASHFQLYLEAMEESRADVTPIKTFLNAIKNGVDYKKALDNDVIPLTVAKFVTFNLNLALNGQVHEVASAFFYGREGLIPEMFKLLIDSLEKEGASNERLNYYLKRHIELDEDEHGPLAKKLLNDLCEGDPKKQEEAIKISKISLHMRKNLWDGVLKEIQDKGL
ncbi:hypothetical protein DNHGIG_39560 [Collibacillus ludicampi]|uniref:DUF3050 domain-containing protein n=1 Tax=Collibacillus ludicampi TaxID=2771369 RepID=A0AAV4LKR5_9BACL|nr:DUF3050 domain-containing protein [Collibacillus ludicampi]GIM48407.1 hypothetical protein DNHGIG_39560 [Collibacillus ludicampi]